jgi:hypothetical protein
MVSQKRKSTGNGNFNSGATVEPFWRRYWFRSFLDITAGGRLLCGLELWAWFDYPWWKFAVPEKAKNLSKEELHTLKVIRLKNRRENKNSFIGITQI